MSIIRFVLTVVVAIGSIITQEALATIRLEEGIPVIEDGVTGGDVRAISQDIDEVMIKAGATQEAVAAIPPHIKCAGIGKKVKPIAVTRIPRHIHKVVIKENLSQSTVTAISPQVRQIIFTNKVKFSDRTITIYFSHLLWGRIDARVTEDSQDYLKYISRWFNKVIIKGDVAPEIMALIPENVVLVEINGAGLTPLSVEKIPPWVKSIIIGDRVTPEAVACIPQHVQVVIIGKDTYLAAIACIPQHIQIIKLRNGIEPLTTSHIPSHVTMVKAEYMYHLEDIMIPYHFSG